MAFAAPAYVEHHGLSAGTVNTNVRVETVDGPRFMRVNEGKSQEDVAREAAIIAHVAARGVSSPLPLRTPAGEPFAVSLHSGAIVSLFPWVAGRTLRRAEVLPRHAYEVGQALAILHRTSDDFTDRRPGRYEPDEIDRRYARLQTATATGDRSIDQELAASLAVLGPELAALRRDRSPNLPVGLIHGDLFIDNVLWSEDDSTFRALLDFEQASWGHLAYDLAVTTLAWCFGRDDFRVDVTTALLAGYAEKRPPTREEWRSFVPELRFAACRFAVTRITDVHQRAGLGAPPGKDYRRYLLRLQRIHQHASDGTFGPPQSRR